MAARNAVLFSLMIFWLTVQSTVAQEDATIESTKLTDQIYMLTGHGGNLGVFIGQDGTFLIDDQFAPLTEKIIAELMVLGGDIPRFLINTHYHGDHTGGNENLGKAGTLIVSHDNVRERLQGGSFIREFNMLIPPAAPVALPVVTFSEDITFHLNGDTVQVIHIPHSHTDGDAIIHFVEANVIHAGDIIFNGFYPFIDVSHGGTIKGMIEGTKLVLSLADDNTKIIPGHGPLTAKAELSGYLQMLETAYERLRKLKADGKTAQEAIEMKPLADLEKEWGDGIFNGDKWIEIIYPGV
jgi:glyoxylase-like metal-dependent hydrolase (beta-lactamase superfamily II)